MLLVAFIIAAVCSVVGFGISLFDNPVSAAWAGATNFVVLLLLNWTVMYFSMPELVGSSIGWMIVANAVITAVIFGLFQGFSQDYEDGYFIASWVFGLVAVFVFVGVMWIWNGWFLGQDNADYLAHQVNVTMEETNAYPNTSDQHMVIVGAQAAKFKANQAMNTESLGTRYQLGEGVLQSVTGHMYYIFELEHIGWNNANQVNYLVPGYVVVDAEDPNAASVPKLDFQMHWVKNGPFGSDVGRYVYDNGYRDVYVDSLTLEVDDNWQPFYTASINTPAVRWQDSVPRAFISVDPQSGSIVRYELDNIPAWVDRVYSADMAKTMLGWWGQWGQADYQAFFGTANNRYKVEDDHEPDIVYTDDGPAWQVLMTSLNSDTSAKYVALFDTRSNRVRMYTAPNGLALQSTVSAAFKNSESNLKGLEASSLALHKIYGQLTWVASMVPSGGGGEEAQSFAGVGLLNATNSDAANVIIGNDKGDALNQLSTQIARGGDNNAPEAEARNQSVTGKIAKVEHVVEGGQTFIVLMLEGDTEHIYRGQVGDDFDGLSEMFAQAGNTVTIGYIDTSNPVRNISSYVDNSLTATSNK